MVAQSSLDASLPIGVFDSGIGGLSVLRHIRQQLQFEDLVYVADSYHAPYGDKGESFVIERSLHIAQFLASLPVKAIVVACNTATAAAVAELRAVYSIPIIGIEPGIKPAAIASCSGVVGVLATSKTAGSEKYARLVSQFGSCKVITQKCPGLVEGIEAMNFHCVKFRGLLQRYIEPMLGEGVDTIVLGCTHYSFIADAIREIAGDAVQLVDTGAPVAAELKRRLSVHSLLKSGLNSPEHRFYTSAQSQQMSPAFTYFWGESTPLLTLP